MITITTSHGKTFDVHYAFAPLFSGKLGIELEDQRRLPEIAQDFDQLTHIHVDDSAAQKSYDFDGYTRLFSIQAANGIVTMQLERENENA